MTLILMILISTSATAQVTKVTGKVTDILTNEPIPFTAVVLKELPMVALLTLMATMLFQR